MATKKYTRINFVDGPPCGAMAQATGLAAATTDNTVNTFMTPGGSPLEVRIEQTNSDIVFTHTTAGWVIPNDNTDNDGIEVSLGIIADADAKYAYKIGTDAAFEASLTFKIPDVSDYDVAVFGFRKAAAYADAPNAPTCFSSAVIYTDAAGFNVNAGAIYTFGGVNQTGGGTGTYTSTDSTLTWADNATKKLTVKVSSAGVVTFYVDDTLVATATAVTFDSTDIVIPFAIFTKGATSSDTPPILKSLLVKTSES